MRAPAPTADLRNNSERRAEVVAPYSPAPTTPDRQSQTRWWNRSRRNFPPDQAPVGRKESRRPLRFCAPEGFCLAQGATPATWDRGPTPPVRGRCREATEGVGWRSYGHEVPVGELPRRGKRGWPGPLVSFPSLGKKLAARTAPAGAFRSATAAKRRLLARRWRRKPPCVQRTQSEICPLIRLA